MYRYTSDLLVLDGQRHLRSWRAPPSLRQVNTPLDWHRWVSRLALHPDLEFARYMVNGLRDGFRIGFDHARCSCGRARANMASTSRDAALVSRYLDEECRLGRVAGPLNPVEFPEVHCSPIGLVPKSSGGFRLIVDLSSPHGRSINDGIDPAVCSMEYVSVDAVAMVVAEMGRGTILAKVNIRSAYRLVPVHPEDRWLLGMMWNGGLYVDTVLPFGLRSAPKIFTAVADAIEWVAKSSGVETVCHYLDDFLLLARPSQGGQQLDCLLATFSDLGVPIAEEKLEGPGTAVTFLGIEVDTEAMVLRLPQRRIVELKELIGIWLGKGSCRRKELQSPAGKLQHACKVVRPGRAFLR